MGPGDTGSKAVKIHALPAVTGKQIQNREPGLAGRGSGLFGGVEHDCARGRGDCERDLGDRINHVHLKDARLPVMAEIIADEAPVTEIWTREAFCALGGGDLDADAVLDGLRRISFGGWLVVEQDILPRSAERFARAAAEQRHNREFLAARGLLGEPD